MSYSESSEKSPRSPDALLPEPVHHAPRQASARTWTNGPLGRLCAALGLVSITLLGTSYLVIALRDAPRPVRMVNPARSEDYTDNSRFLNSRNATSRFRDNLRSSKDKFITAWPSSGWTNDVMAAVNVVYMGMITGRTPVIPPFTPSHVGSISEVGPLRFGDIFDVPRLASKLGMHILEWDELKNPVTGANGPSEVEKLGCWSAWSLNEVMGGGPRESHAPEWYNLDISYTPVPKSFTLTHGLRHNQYYASLWSLASLAFPKTRDWAWREMGSQTFPVTSGSGEKLQPDDQMLCYDLLYYVGLANEEEWFDDYSPYWRMVATHMHWAPKLFQLAESYLRRHFKVADGQPIPPFISVHVRRSDFAGWCPSNMNSEACFAPSSAYARRVREIQAALRARPEPVDARAVLVTSDERSAEWWEEIAAFGPEWTWVDHGVEQTVEKHGKWFPVILDAVFQSMGTGFVGTDHSTMSFISQRRVEDWQGGMGQVVRWGTPNADDH